MEILMSAFVPAAYRTLRNVSSKRKALMWSCGVAAIAAAAVAPHKARAQSFQGTGTFTTNGGGSAGITTSTNNTTINLNAGQTVIDWAPSDTSVGNFGAIGFQYSGTTATF